MAEVIANGLRFHVAELGTAGDDDRPTIIFVHGLIMDNLSSYYYTLAPRAATYARVLMYDLRGHGRTERPTSGYSLDTAVDDLFAVADALGATGPVHLVGNSYGGTISLHAAMTRPDRVASLLLIEAHPVVDNWGDQIMAHLEEIVGGFDDDGVRDWIKAEGGRKLQRMAGTCEQLVTKTSLPHDLRAESPPSVQQYAAISCPSLCIYGEYSDIIDRAESLHAHLPNNTLEIFEGCSHSVLMEAPEDLDVVLADWIAAQRSAVPT